MKIIELPAFEVGILFAKNKVGARNIGMIKGGEKQQVFIRMGEGLERQMTVASGLD